MDAEAARQIEVCTRRCRARCCGYLTVHVDAPRAHADWDEMRWWLAHEGTMVTKDEDGWLLHVKTPCRHLRADNLCGIYQDRMTTCAGYDAATCEFVDAVPFPLELRSEADLADHLERRKLRRGAAVARAIRAVAAARAEPLVALSGLAAR